MNSMGKKTTEIRHRSQSAKLKDTATFGYDYSKDYADKSWPYFSGKLDRSGKVILIVFPLVIISGITFVWYSSNVRARLWTPLDKPRIVPVVNDMIGKDSNLRYWGTYRSHLYFGLKTRHPQATVVGWRMF